MRRNILLAAIAAVAFSGSSALAADLGYPAGPMTYPAVPVTYSWTGCYIGAQVGGGGMYSSWTDTDQDGAGPGIGAVYGGQTGCNYQVKQVVLGVEGELWGSSINTQSVSTFVDNFGDIDTDRAQAKNLWDATVALRLGYALDRSLFYGKVGVDWARFNFTSSEFDTCPTCTPFSESQSGSTTVTGLLLGFGYEYAFLNNWTAKIEYNYIAFGTPTVNTQFFESGTPPTTGTVGSTNTNSKQIIKMGLNYKFNWWGGP